MENVPYTVEKNVYSSTLGWDYSVSLDRILKSPIFAFFITCSDVEA
jgi:hypothetical protein